MRIKNARVFVGKTFIDADIDFDQKINAVGKLEGEADFDAAGMDEAFMRANRIVREEC